MAKRKPVGSSPGRTEVKHRLMRGLVGEEVGVVGNLYRVDRLAWIDLNAGDAVPAHEGRWRDSCSPGILAYHATNARKPVQVDLYEKDPAVYSRLVSRLAAELAELGYARHSESEWRIGSRVRLMAFNRDGRDAPVGHIGRRDAALVLHDPNAITEWAMRSTFPAEVADRTEWFRSFSTLGCNVCGIKRTPLSGPEPLFDDGMSPTERRNWFKLLATQEETIPKKRDLLLIAIEHDCAQWAYLLSTATTGAWRDKTEARVKAAFGGTGLAAEMAWMQRDHDNYERIKRTLFLTQKELRDEANTPLPFDDPNGEAA